MKFLVAVLLWRPSYPFILEQLARANPSLELDVVLTNDTGQSLQIPESILCKFNQIKIFNSPNDLFVHCPEYLDIQSFHEIINQFKGTCLWENILLIYALANNYDSIIFWEDDQIPIWEGGNDFFSSQLLMLHAEKDAHLCISKRLGYLHKVPPYLKKYMSNNILHILEEALCICNEIVFPGLLTGEAECFIPYGTISQYGGIESFAGRKFIYAGSTAINLKNEVPCFFDVPDLNGYNFSRGNDVFLSLAYGQDAKFIEAESSYFHDPLLFSQGKGDLISSFKEPIDFFDKNNFLYLINGWLSYGPLLLRLSYPNDWQIYINDVKSILKTLPFNFSPMYRNFCTFSDRVHNDFYLFQHIQCSWKNTCDQIRLNKGDATIFEEFQVKS